MDPTLYRAAASGNVRLLQQVAETNAQLLFSQAPQQNTALHLAIKFGHVDFTKEILKLCGQLLSMTNSNGDTALHCAARAGPREVIEILVDYPEDRGSFVGLLGMQNKEGDTALHEALRHRREDIAIRMLRADPRLPFVVNNARESSFLVAAKEEMEEVVKDMLSIDGGSANINSGEFQAAAISNDSELTVEEKRELIRMQDKTGRTALHYAVRRNNAQIVSMILTTDSHHVPYITDNNGHSPLHVAATFGTQCSMLELLKHCPDSVEQLDVSRRNVLHIALVNQQNNIISQLLKLPHVGGLLKELDSKQGKTPVQLASEEDMPSLVALEGGGVDQLKMRNKDDQTAFELGSFSRHSSALDPPTLIPNMDPKLYKAATSGDVGFLEKMANATANTQLLLLSKAPQGNTALHIAAKFGHAHFTRKILQLCNQLLKMQNSNDDTALHCAARAGCLEIVKILLEFELTMGHDAVEGEGGSSSVALLRMQNKEGDTALHEALRKQQEDMAIKMVRADPSVASVVNNAKESSFLLAVKEQMEEVIKQMLSIDLSNNSSGEVQTSAIIGNTSACIVIPITALPQLTSEKRTELIRIKDSAGRNALHYAAWRNNAKIIRMILKTDSFHVPYMVDNNGHSPLHVAVAFGRKWSMLEMLTHCPDTIEQLDTSGRNILQIALSNRRFEIIQQLLELTHIGGLLGGPAQEENTPICLISGEDKCTSVVADDKAELETMRNEDVQLVLAHDSVHRYYFYLPMDVGHHFKKLGDRILLSNEDLIRLLLQESDPSMGIKTINNPFLASRFFKQSQEPNSLTNEALHPGV